MEAEEIADHLHVAIPFLPHGKVRALREDDKLRAPDPSMQGASNSRRDLVIAAARDQGGRADPGKLIRDVPVSERAMDRELAGPPHRPVHRETEFRHRFRQLGWPGPKATDVASVEDHRRPLIGRIVEGLLSFQPSDRPLDSGRQPGHQAAEFGVRHRDARKPARDDEAPQVPLVLEGIGDRKHAAVAVPEEMDPAKAQGSAESLHLFDGPFDREEGRASRSVARPTSELVIEHDPIAEPREVREAGEVSVRHARTAVETEEGAPIRCAERLPGQAISEDLGAPFRGRSNGGHDNSGAAIAATGL